MIDSLLGVELPLPVKLIVAFVIVLVLIALATWVFRRLGGDRIGPNAARGRQPRLAVIDAASVDGRRRLVLLRRDNVEHLVMIGGPTDIVIEQNIVRAVPVSPPRDAQAPRPQAEPAPPRPTASEQMLQRTPSEYRAALNEPPQRARLEPVARPPRAELARHAPTEPPRALRAAAARRPEAEAPPVEVHHAPPTADTNLADMANKLEAALRRPQPKRPEEPELSAPAPLAATPPAAAPAAEPAPAPAVRPQPTPAVPMAQSAPPIAASIPEPKPAPAGAASAAPAGKTSFDSLEEEMASLLGRPPGKT